MRPKLTAHKLADGIDTAVSNQTMQQNAATLGAKIRAEAGIGRAVRLIEKQM